MKKQTPEQAATVSALDVLVKECDARIVDGEQEQLYTFRWGNNHIRKAMQGRVCRVIARGKMNSCCIQFVNNGQREIVSRNAIRKYNA